jgi:hypothetical protein
MRVPLLTLALLVAPLPSPPSAQVVDAAGNVTIVKKKQVLSRGELKKKLKERKAKLAKGEDVSDNEELDAMLEAAEAS